MVLRRGSFLRFRRRSLPVFLQIDPSPYLGFTIVMLCMFMTAVPYTHPGRALDLPVVARANEIPHLLRYDAITIAVTRDGSVYFHNRRIDPIDLPNRIHDAILNGAEKRIYLKVDARAQYGDIAAILPYIQLAGVQDVSFPVATPVAPG